MEATAIFSRHAITPAHSKKTLEAELADAKKKRKILQHVGALKTGIFTLEIAT